MHHWDIVHERAVAPSPIVPTYRPPPKRRNSSMPSTVSGSPDSVRSRGGSGPRPQARSAGMAERPSRNESLSDLVRFFQTQNMPPASSAPPVVGSPESTTALPVMVSPEPKEPATELTKEQLKPLHRRLLQFTQRPKKESTPRSKSDDNQKQIEALQREGYLMSSSKPKSTSDRSKSSSKTSLDRSTKTSLDRPKSSLERTFSRSKKQDVEAIGRPWLSRSDSNRSSNDPKRRLASLDLDDFGSMLDVTVSLSEFDDLSPPPYRPSSINAPTSRNPVNPSLASSSSVAESALPMPRPSSEACLRPSDRLITPSISTLETQGSGLTDDLPQPSSSTNSSIGVSDRDHTKASSLLSIDPSPSVTASDQSLRSEPSQCQAIEQPQAPARPPPNPPGSTTSTPTHSLKLFPDVAPPRISSKNAWRLSSAPRYQTTTTTKTAPPLKTEFQPETPKENSPPEVQRQPAETPAVSTKKEEEEPASAALGTAITSDPVPGEAKKRHTALIQGQRKPRPPSLAMGTLQAFPLPAPTRPLPSIPKSNTLAPPVDPRTPSGVRATRSVSKMSSIQHPQPSPIAEEPREPEPRPATALGQTSTGQNEDDDAMSLQTTPERPKSTTPEQYTPRRRSLSVGVPRMRPFPESPIRIDESTTDDQPLADSPVLGQMSQVSHGKRATRKDLQINTRTDRKHLPFGLPSPPPSAALPLDPPAQKSVDRSSHRNYTAPVHAGVHHQKSLESSFGSTNHRASLVSRSNSSRSSLRHESIPESSYEEPSRAESPLPSSDDEGFGPNGATKHAYLIEDKQKQKQRAHQLRRGYETVDGRTSHGRPRYTHPRPSTPQGHRSHGFDKSLSPQSHYSQSTMRSRDSQSSHRYRAPAQDANNLLEDRIANLERQNQVLQAALMAALNAGIKPNIDLHESAIPPSFSTAGLGNPYQGYQGRHAMRPDSWMSSSRSSELSGFETPGSVRDARANARQLDNMLEDIETGWMSDKSSVGARSMARHR